VVTVNVSSWRSQDAAGIAADIKSAIDADLDNLVTCESVTEAQGIAWEPIGKEGGGSA
jgi:hypothetical protein